MISFTNVPRHQLQDCASLCWKSGSGSLYAALARNWLSSVSNLFERETTMLTRRTLLVALVPLIAVPGCVIPHPSRRGRHGKHDHDDDDARDRRRNRNRQYD